MHEAMKLRKTEISLLVLGALVLAFHVVKVLLVLTQLPSEIPLKFDLTGAPSNYSDAKMIWLLPILGVVMQILFMIVGSRPHTHNLPWKVTDQNREALFRHSIQFVFTLNVMAQVTFFMSTASIVETALQTGTRGSLYLLPVLIILLGSVIAIFYFKGRKIAQT